MQNTGAAAESPHQALPIAWFGGRVLAQIIDAAIWGVGVTAIGAMFVVLGPATFSMAHPIWQERVCKRLQTIPPAAPAVQGLNPQAAFHCARSFFHLKLADEVALVEQRRGSAGMVTHSFVYQSDEQLKPTKAVDVDGFLWLKFYVYVVIAQGRFGTTLGKKALRLRVVDENGMAPGIKAALLRNLVLNLPIFVFGVLAFPALLTGAFVTSMGLLFFVGALCLLLNLAIVGNVWWTATHERPSIHDRVAGTRVVRLPVRL